MHLPTCKHFKINAVKKFRFQVFLMFTEWKLKACLPVTAKVEICLASQPYGKYDIFSFETASDQIECYSQYLLRKLYSLVIVIYVYNIRVLCFQYTAEMQTCLETQAIRNTIYTPLRNWIRWDILQWPVSTLEMVFSCHCHLCQRLVIQLNLLLREKLCINIS